MKALKAWTIVTLILALAALALVIVCIFRPYGFGLWVVTSYEDMTSTFGHTIEGMYNKLSLISVISFGVLFVTNQILLWTYIAKNKKATSEEKTTKVKKEEPKKENTDDKLTEEEKMILKRIRKEVSKEKKEKAKRIGKRVAKVVVEEITETKPEENVTTETPVAKSGNVKLANFLDSFR